MAAGKLPDGMPENIGLLQSTEENFEAWRETAEICKILSCNILVVQTPPKFDSTREHIGNIKGFFSRVKRPCAAAWEPRGRWDQETIRGLCSDLNLIHVVDPFRNRPAKGSEVVYFRLHGIGEGDVNYRYRFTDSDLKRLADLVALYSDAGEIYVMFNNMYMGEDALRFKKMMMLTV